MYNTRCSFICHDFNWSIVFSFIPPTVLHLYSLMDDTGIFRFQEQDYVINLHYTNFHFVCSVKLGKYIWIYDSLILNASGKEMRVKDLAPQLTMLHGNLETYSIDVRCSQYQGLINDCGLFMVANALILVDRKDLQNFVLHENMRIQMYSMLVSNPPMLKLFRTVDFYDSSVSRQSGIRKRGLLAGEQNLQYSKASDWMVSKV